MRMCGWILTILGYLWAFSGCVRIGLFAMHGGPMAGQMILISLGTLVLAALALWGGSSSGIKPMRGHTHWNKTVSRHA
ncbi:hypothetical protein [Pseudomonas fluorescens]